MDKPARPAASKLKWIAGRWLQSAALAPLAQRKASVALAKGILLWGRRTLILAPSQALRFGSHQALAATAHNARGDYAALVSGWRHGISCGLFHPTALILVRGHERGAQQIYLRAMASWMPATPPEQKELTEPSLTRRQWLVIRGPNKSRRPRRWRPCSPLPGPRFLRGSWGSQGMIASHLHGVSSPGKCQDAGGKPHVDTDSRKGEFSHRGRSFPVVATRSSAALLDCESERPANLGCHCQISPSPSELSPHTTGRTPACMLENETTAGAMEKQAILLLSCLGLHEPHVRGQRLADCLCVAASFLGESRRASGSKHPWGDEASSNGQHR